MKRLALLAAIAGCTKHPAISAGVAGGSIGWISCEMSDPPRQRTCGYIGGGVGLALGALAFLITTFTDTSAHELPPDEEILDNGTVRLHTHTAPPPFAVPDAGVGDAPVARDAPVDAGVADQ